MKYTHNLNRTEETMKKTTVEEIAILEERVATAVGTAGTPK